MGYRPDVLGSKLVATRVFFCAQKGRDRPCHQLRFYTGGTDKSLARSGKEQATATEDFDVHVSYLYS